VATSEDDILSRVEAFVHARLGPEASVEGVTRVATGRSRENWLFDVDRPDGDGRAREPLIARRDPLGGLLETDRAVEFAVLQALGPTAVPAPPARWLDATGEELGRPCLVMGRLPGVCDYHVLNGAAPLPGRLDLARRLCQLLVDVHAVDWAGSGLGGVLGDPGPEAARSALAEWEAILQRNQLESYPELTLAAGWLRAHAPRSPGTVLVHGDFKPGNVLLEDGRIVALLDWELAHLGDPHEDLGWVTQPLRTREHSIPGAWERAELLACYEELSGRRVDHDAVAWWNVLACYKTAVMQVSGLRAFVEGRSDALYQPTAAVLGLLLEQVG
jgi:aminoglycoside phosphotransferase (APT) family kinase protein